MLDTGCWMPAINASDSCGNLSPTDKGFCAWINAGRNKQMKMFFIVEG